jgi:diaminohydroxyphosphoribosylaminopyrimidine deaminase/5-amino-6-(5-phosphoribosylamino)uracil reductase
MVKIKDLSNETLMKRALELAEQARGFTSPNPMVGAVIVKGNKIIAEGFHKKCGSDHGEIVALKQAKSRAKGAKLIINLEPCSHYGHTPPCVDAVIKSGIKEIVIGMKDPNSKTNGKSIAKLRKSGVKVSVGILQKECEGLNEVFIKYIKSGMPFVTAKCAQTLDGKVATADRQSKWITSEKTRQWARAKRMEFDAIMVGINTVIKDNPALNTGSSKAIKKIVVDTTLRVSLKSRLFEGASRGNCFIATSVKASERDIHLFQHHGIDVIVCPLRNGQVDLSVLLKELAKKEISNILIEGGSELVGSALRDNLVDKMHIYVAPKIMGDQKALSSVTIGAVRDLNKLVTLNRIEVKSLNEDLFISGYVHRNH